MLGVSWMLVVMINGSYCASDVPITTLLVILAVVAIIVFALIFQMTEADESVHLSHEPDSRVLRLRRVPVPGMWPHGPQV
ncbi:hypothetical protein CPAR01_01695 [Colletotrichum paranaense]|uniref:Uncharacterized protein n=1 Tax=Colletotrichum paranaense TaxID=1914294 RepID=A0ABQ9T7H4_9PEZI|nr:uncharacterized protein CPAR01_01695 [Colletotrichum paranaense]KAK1547728.1 hypothetical protein CPAR01_01695 [Colletotrichum paranaense]